MNLAFVCVGGGRGVRFGGDKLVEKLGRQTVLETALVALHRAEPTALTVVVVENSKVASWRDFLSPEFPHVRVVAGGDRRQDSVREGVLFAAQAGAEVVAVHDAVRPLVDEADVRAVIAALGGVSGAILTSRIVDTVKRVDGDEKVVDTIPRERLRMALTPQVYRVSTLMEVWARSDMTRTWTDEAALLEAAGLPVRAVLARYPNPKVTTEADLQIVRAMVERAP